MTENIEPISQENHKDLRVKSSYTFEHVEGAQFMPVNANEYGYASTCYPLFFIKDRTTAKFFAVALFGLEKGENLFYSKEQWQASYIPKLMSVAPFSMVSVKTPDDEQEWVACVDTGSSYVSSLEGEPLYSEGSETPYLQQVRKALAGLYRDKANTMVFIDRLLELKLLKPVKLHLVYEDGDKQVMDGIYSVDEKALKKLAADQVQEFHEKGYFSCLYSVLNSQHKLYDIIRLKRAGEGRQLKALQVVDDVSGAAA